jgi:hypothetical protein
MSYIYIQARLGDGEILGYGNSPPVHVIDGCDLAIIDDSGGTCAPDSGLHKIDWLTSDIVDKTHDERSFALVPRPFEVRIAVSNELAATDQYTAPDRPMSEATRRAWLAYRQGLRNLSKLNKTPSAMIKAWPERPDGFDPISALRARI